MTGKRGKNFNKNCAWQIIVAFRSGGRKTATNMDILYKPGRRANNEQRWMFQQQFQAEGILFGDGSNDELLIINLTTVTGRRKYISRPCISAWPLVNRRQHIFINDT